MIHSNSKGEKFPLNPCAPDPEFTFPEAAMVSNLLGILESVLHVCADPGVIPPTRRHSACTALPFAGLPCRRLKRIPVPCSFSVFIFIKSVHENGLESNNSSRLLRKIALFCCISNFHFSSDNTIISTLVAGILIFSSFRHYRLTSHHERLGFSSLTSLLCPYCRFLTHTRVHTHTRAPSHKLPI